MSTRCKLAADANRRMAEAGPKPMRPRSDDPTDAHPSAAEVALVVAGATWRARTQVSMARRAGVAVDSARYRIIATNEPYPPNARFNRLLASQDAAL
ncbi:MAG: hypothetical protein EA356_06870 [Geminicoccaceae bacterium]|nr:MAG: hypothetical protein EA356_06870 [Geminicoccaceae bacterium]